MQDHRAKQFDQRQEIKNQIMWFYQALYAASYIPDEGLRQETIREIVEAQRFLRTESFTPDVKIEMPNAADLSMFKPDFVPAGGKMDRRV